MSYRLLLAASCMLLNFFLFSQLPVRSNAYDADGLRTGDWIVFFDSTYTHELTLGDEAIKYYCLIKFSKDQPKGTVECFYMDGIKQFKGFLLSYDPMVKHGQSITYHTNGSVDFIARYEYDSLHGPVKGYHSNGVLSTVGVFHKNKKEGPWEYYHDNGQLRLTNEFLRDQANGEVIFYRTDGSLSSKGNYQADKQHGTWTNYHPNGNIQTISHWENDLEEGETIHYYSSGSIKEIDQTKDGKLHGPVVSYFPNGNKASEENYIRGKKDGEFTYYYDNGQVKSQGSIVQESYEGLWAYYYADGQLQSEGRYENHEEENLWKYYDSLGNIKYMGELSEGLWNGTYSGFHPNGQVSRTGSYVKDVQQGEWKFYNELGVLTGIINFHEGKMHGLYISYSDDGTLLQKGPMADDEMNGGWHFYHSNGALSTTGEYKNGVNNGFFTFYHENGNKRKRGNYIDGKSVGNWQYFDENEAIEAEGQFVDGQKSGDWTYYHSNGQVYAIGPYVEGKSSGHWKYYTSTGLLTKEGNEKGDILHGHWIYYDEAERKTQEGDWVSDLQQGTWTYYDTLGRVTSTTEYNYGKALNFDTYYDSAILLSERGQFEEALALAKIAENEQRENIAKRGIGYSNVYSLYGYIYGDMKDYQPSIRYFKKALANAEKYAADTSDWVLANAFALGSAYFSAKQFEGAQQTVKLIKMKLQKMNKGLQRQEYSDAISMESRILSHTGQTEAAFQLLSNNYEKNTKHNADSVHVASGALILIQYAGDINKNRYVLEATQELMTHCETNGLTTHYTYPSAIYARAKALADTAYDSAMKLFQKSIALYYISGDTLFNQFLDAHIILGNHYYSQSHYDSAQYYFGQVFIRLKNQGWLDHYMYRRSLISLAKNFYLKSQYDLAVEFLQATIDAQLATDNQDLEELGQAYQGMALNMERLSDYPEANKFHLLAINTIPSENKYETHYANSLLLYATFLKSQHKYDEAFSYQRQLVAYNRKYESPDLDMEIGAHSSLAIIYYELQQFDSALFYYKKAIEVIQKEPAFHIKVYAEILRGMADIYEDKEMYKEAQAYNLKALTVLEDYIGTDNFQYATTLLEIGRNFEFQQVPATAIQYHKRALDIWERTTSSNHPNYIYSLVALARAQRANDNAREALENLITAQNYYIDRGDTQSADYKRCLNELALTYESDQINNQIAAEKSNLEALKIVEKNYSKNNIEYAYQLDKLSSYYSRQYAYERAAPLKEEAIRIIKSSNGRTLQYAQYINGLSWIRYQLGQYPEAIQLKEEAIAIMASEAKTSEDYMNAVYGLGEYYVTLGRYEDAVDMYKQSIDIVYDKYGSFSYAMTSPIMALGTTYYRWKKPSEALDYMVKVESLYDSLGAEDDDYLAIHNMTGLILLDLKEWEQAKDRLEKALAIAIRLWPDDHDASYVYRNNLAFYYMATEQYAKAEDLWLGVEKSVLNQRRAIDKVRWLDNMATLYQAWGKLNDAGKYWNETLEILYDKIETDFPYLSERGKAAFWDAYREDFEYYNSYALKAYQSGDAGVTRKMYDNQILTKSLLLTTSAKERKRILNSGDSTMISIYNQYIDLKKNVALYYGYTKEQLLVENITINDLEKELERFEKVLSIDANAMNQQRQKESLKWKNIQKTLTANEAAIEIIRFRHYDKVVSDSVIYAALILTSETNREPVLVILPNGDDLEGKYLKAYKSSIQYKFDDNNSYSQYWQPIQKHLKGVDKIYLSLDGVYNQININTLRLEDESFLADHFDITFLTSTRDIPEIKTRTRGQTLTQTGYIFGYPKYDLTHDDIRTRMKERGITSSVSTERGTNLSRKGFSELPGTRVETQSITDLLSNYQWTTSLYLGDEALEEELKRVHNPQLLHIATHGFFLEDTNTSSSSMELGINTEASSTNPLLRSGLLLSGATQTARGEHTPGIENGIFTAYEAMNLNLEDTELVVLSACETGRGEIKNGEGVYGLQRAFQIAGAETIIMSLWKVDDEATQLLMQSFYKEWLAGENKNKALKKAQSIVRNRYQDPYYWGAFVMVE